MSRLLEIENVRIRFRCKSRGRALLDRDDDPYIDAVCGASLTIAAGQTFALVGESGAGKTTVFNLLHDNWNCYLDLGRLVDPDFFYFHKIFHVVVDTKELGQ